MNQRDAQTIHDLLMTRVQPANAREGVAIAALAHKLVSHFAQKAASQQDSAAVATVSE